MKSELEQRDDEISDHVSSLETLVERLNTADSLLRVKEQQVGAEGCEGGGESGRVGGGRVRVQECTAYLASYVRQRRAPPMLKSHMVHLQGPPGRAAP